MNRPKILQLEESEKRVPFEPLATVGWAPQQFGPRGVQFKHDYDNLDEVEWALLRVGRFQIVLQHHLHSPSPGTDVLRTSDANPQEALQTFVDAFSIPLTELTWLAPGVERSRVVRP